MDSIDKIVTSRIHRIHAEIKYYEAKVATRKETLNVEIKHRKMMKERINLLIR
jgi:hypothetical protein